MRLISLTVQNPRRRVPRRAVRHPVHWAVTEINGKSVREAWVVDVSSMGARLDTTSPLNPSLPVQFKVILPDGETELLLNGRVVWMRPVFANRGHFQQGIQFYGTNWELERLARNKSPG